MLWWLIKGDTIRARCLGRLAIPLIQWALGRSCYD